MLNVEAHACLEFQHLSRESVQKPGIPHNANMLSNITYFLVIQNYDLVENPKSDVLRIPLVAKNTLMTPSSHWNKNLLFSNLKSNI